MICVSKAISNVGMTLLILTGSASAQAPDCTGISDVSDFDCVYQGAENRLLDADFVVPAPGELFYYLVNAVNAAGEETRPGNRSDGSPRSVNTASACPT